MLLLVPSRAIPLLLRPPARLAARAAALASSSRRCMHPPLPRAASPAAAAADAAAAPSSPKRAKTTTTTTTMSAAAAPAAAAAAAAPATKKAIGTHSGTFHCDEALGCWMLRRTAAFADWPVVRTRDAEALAALPIVIDVGGAYDPAAGRLDHHQRGFGEAFGHGHGVKLSSAGLVYRHHGREVVRRVMRDRGADGAEDDAAVERVYLRVYKTFVKAVDAIDNGVEPYAAAAGAAPLGPPLYTDGTTLAARVARLNPEWNAPAEAQTNAALDAAFERAVEMAGGEFADEVARVAASWLPARGIVEASVAARAGVDPSGRVVRLESFCPWKEHLYDIEEELGLGDDASVLYVLYEDDRERKWRIQCVAKGPGSFESRRAMPEPWRGLRDAALSAAAGVEGCVFCHASGFIGGADTYEAVLAMARASLGAAGK
jgi:uncharacterized UPF0160 family protein